MNNQEQINKQIDVNEVYERPTMEVIEMEMEGILCGSADDYQPGGGKDW